MSPDLEQSEVRASLGNDQQSGQLSTLSEKMLSRNMRGYWQSRSEKTRMEPYLWTWPEISECIRAAGTLVSVGPGGMALRRNIGLINPSVGGDTSPTIAMGVQLVNPGETALAHRHTASAIRFVIEGDAGTTTSNGERMMMARGDLLIQPNWTWHDHANDADKPVVWLDLLDVGLVNFLDSNFHENYPGDSQPITKPLDYGTSRYGTVRTSLNGDPKHEPPFRYEWKDTWRALQAAVEDGQSNPFDGVLLGYRNPVTGSTTFRSMDCQIQLLMPGQATRTHRHTGHSLYHVFEGNGETVIDRERSMKWGDGDCFVLPSWRWHHHRNISKQSPAVLFSVTDRPLLEAMRLYREEDGDTN